MLSSKTSNADPDPDPDTDSDPEANSIYLAPEFGDSSLCSYSSTCGSDSERELFLEFFCWPT